MLRLEVRGCSTGRATGNADHALSLWLLRVPSVLNLWMHFFYSLGGAGRHPEEKFSV